MVSSYKHALIVGAGAGLSASLARLFAAEGLRVTLAARSTDDLAEICRDIGAEARACDATSPDDVNALFQALDSAPPDVVVYNPSARERGPFTEIDPEGVRQGLMVTAYGGFLVAQQAVKRMLPQGHGAVLFTGASASVKGYAHSASFAMGKFALRGLAQSMARELHPKGIHVAHFVIDGGIRNPARSERMDATDNPDSMLDPDAIARSYRGILRQDRSAWAWEIELRPWVESF
ncbi:MAG: SDR family NAD(P)-dependent oxidoreductase [Alphaproteobacteria bacterium]|jgi:NAD(P)-dependent dehydrogenase (short-subunit alcohol dehydrogenase family)|nr:SDR family NAD(P)-dependent oxidoreductase [Alphaproteobacteria bacterium]